MSPSTETPFKIEIPEEKLVFLRKKLELAVLPDELENVGRDYGVPLTDVKRLVARWKEGYDWRKYEAKLNELPQYIGTIEVDEFKEFTVHYVHQKSTVKNAIPLLFVHGWPGSFIEVQKVLPLLVKASEAHPSFHVVAPSLPGYGFSSAPTKAGFKTTQYYELFNKLMISLGYSEYVTQGGNWGAMLTRRLALVHGGKHVKAWHINCPLIADSPVGLLAWNYEKLVAWTDHYKWEDDEVLTWISIYWFSRAGPAAAMRIYYEVLGQNDDKQDNTSIPMGHSYFLEDIFLLIPFIRSLKAPNLVFESTHARGGHLAACEKPELPVDYVRKMFGRGGPAAGVVPGCNGYD